jgi:hypothetical protein
MSPLANSRRAVRILHLAFVVTWFLFVLVVVLVKPAVQPMQPLLPFLFALAAFGSVSLGFVLRKARIDRPLEVLRNAPDDPQALILWRSGNLTLFVLAETVTLMGLVLKFLGATWAVAGVFFFAGLFLTLLWTPRMDFPNA